MDQLNEDRKEWASSVNPLVLHSYPTIAASQDSKEREESSK